MMYTLHHGDCLDILPTFAAQSVDAIIADPPYGTTACKWDSVIPFEPMWKELKRIIKPRGAIVLFGSQPFTSALVMSNPAMFRYEWTWNKVNLFTRQLDAYRRPMLQHENILVFADGRTTYNPQMRKGKPYSGRGTSGYVQHYGNGADVAPRNVGNTTGLSLPGTILDIAAISSELRGLHPTQKPLALLAYLVKTYTNEGGTVLDFTMGSGTTGEACIETGRDFIGIEKEQQYYDIAAKRLETAAARMVQMELAV